MVCGGFAPPWRVLACSVRRQRVLSRMNGMFLGCIVWSFLLVWVGVRPKMSKAIRYIEFDLHIACYSMIFSRVVLSVGHVPSTDSFLFSLCKVVYYII